MSAKGRAFTEDDFWGALQKRFAPGQDSKVLKGIGDDCAVIETDKGALLASTDALVEGTHFISRLTTPQFLGKKSVYISASDIGAMGGAAKYLLVSLALSSNVDKTFLGGLYDGISSACKELSITLIGGNTARTDGPLSITTTILGSVPKDMAVLRSTARAGDSVYLTGFAGDSALGLLVLRRMGLKRALMGRYKKAVSRHLCPIPRLAIGRELASKGLATAMLDVSDGVALDLERLARASKVSVHIDASLISLSSEMSGYLKDSKDPLEGMKSLVLSGGEDYELLFTAQAKDNEKIMRIAKRSGIEIRRIGEVKKGQGVSITNNKEPLALERKGFLHF